MTAVMMIYVIKIGSQNQFLIVIHFYNLENVSIIIIITCKLFKLVAVMMTLLLERHQRITNSQRNCILPKKIGKLILLIHQNDIITQQLHILQLLINGL